MMELAPPSISGLAPERLMHLILAHGYCITLFDYQFQKFNRCAFFQKYHPVILQIIFIFNNPIDAEYGLGCSFLIIYLCVKKMSIITYHV
jgi:hypothetical protein